jgi:hypothetical protein
MSVFASPLAMMKPRTGHWGRQALAVIAEVHGKLPSGATLDERKAAVDAAYPFGPREYHPYKEWLKVRADYLQLFGYVSKGKKKVGKWRDEAPGLFAESPMERMMRRAKPQTATPAPTSSHGLARPCANSPGAGATKSGAAT